MTYSLRLWVTILFGLLAMSCGYSAAHQVPGASLTKEGLQMSVVGQRCYVNRTADPFRTSVGDDQLDVDLLVGVANRSNRAAVVDPQRMVVVEDVDGAQVDLKAAKQPTVTVQPGESKRVPMRFERGGDLDCHHALALEPGDAVTLDGQAVALQRILFSTAN